jgi:chitodextrinase
MKKLTSVLVALALLTAPVKAEQCKAPPAQHEGMLLELVTVAAVISWLSAMYWASSANYDEYMEAKKRLNVPELEKKCEWVAKKK